MKTKVRMMVTVWFIRDYNKMIFDFLKMEFEVACASQTQGWFIYNIIIFYSHIFSYVKMIGCVYKKFV